MPVQIVRNDITRMDCDAIVNAANRKLQGGGGVVLMAPYIRRQGQGCMRNAGLLADARLDKQKSQKDITFRVNTLSTLLARARRKILYQRFSTKLGISHI